MESDLNIPNLHVGSDWDCQLCDHTVPVPTLTEIAALQYCECSLAISFARSLQLSTAMDAG